MKRRDLLQGGTLVLLLAGHQIARGASIVAVRLWPAPEYTRLTIESDGLLSSRHLMAHAPPRLAVDIEGLELSPALRELVAKVQADDPFIAGMRIAQHAPGVVRLVVDLKQPTLPQLFHLPPIAAYRHRLVVDFHPMQAADPLEALIAERMRERPPPASAPANPAPAADPLGELIARRGEPGAAPAPAQPRGGDADRPATRQPPRRTDRLIIVALDPGHGGEDPGAIGPGGTREKDVVLQVAQRLRERINAATVNGNPMRAYLTRDADFFVPLHVRVQKARRVQADLFVSIHADAFITPAARGASVFALSQGRRALAGRQGEPGRPDRRRQRARAGPARGARHAGHEHHGADQRQPEAGRRAAGRDRAGRQAAQGARGTGRLRRAEGARHPQRAGGDRVHQQPGRRGPAAQRRLPGTAGRCAHAWHPALLRAQSAARAQPHRLIPGPCGGGAAEARRIAGRRLQSDACTLSFTQTTPRVKRLLQPRCAGVSTVVFTSKAAALGSGSRNNPRKDLL
jgi:N-acetylmuramoyl-L-alanine amidase